MEQKQKRGFWDQLCSKAFWMDFLSNLALEFIRGFSLALGGLITYYATEKLGRSILPPQQPKVQPTPQPQPQPQGSYYSGYQSTGSERFPGFK